jgi:hypothetical protein
MPEALRLALQSVLGTMTGLTRQIRSYDRTVEGLCSEPYSESRQLCGISGVGLLAAQAFVLTLEDHGRFRKSRRLARYPTWRYGRTNRGIVVRSFAAPKREIVSFDGFRRGE